MGTVSIKGEPSEWAQSLPRVIILQHNTIHNFTKTRRVIHFIHPKLTLTPQKLDLTVYQDLPMTANVKVNLICQVKVIFTDEFITLTVKHMPALGNGHWKA